MRFLRTLISLGFVVFGVAVLVLALGAYLTATGRSVPVMRMAAAKAGDLLAGQTIEQMTLSLSVEPSRSRIDGVAQLRIRADVPRQRLYLLLNDGLVIHRVWRQLPEGRRQILRHTRMWLLAGIDLDHALAPGEEATLVISYGGDPLAGLSPFGQRVMEADEVILSSSALWYPTDARSFIHADVEVTLPASLAPVHNGTKVAVANLGNSRRTRWSMERPVPGLALVAGHHRHHERNEAGVSFQTRVGSGIMLDPEVLSQSMAETFAAIGAVNGPSGAVRQTLFVSRRLQRPMVDGSGLIGLSPRHFTGADYGYAAIADAIARTWWGGAVSADPLRPQSAGAWVMDGFAANSTRLAVRDRFGSDAERRWRLRHSFDPTAAGALVEYSSLDVELSEQDAAALRGKVAYVAMMLHDRIGDAAYDAAMKVIFERFRGRSVSSDEVRDIISESSGVELASFFEQWVELVGGIDLSLDPVQGEAKVANHDTVALTGTVELWRVPPGGQPVAQVFNVGDGTPVGNAERLVVDPRGLLADMYRSNNVLPREDAPRAIARSPRGSWMIVEGEAHDWAPARIREIDSAGKTLHVWDFDRGILGDPHWSASGTHILAAEPARGNTVKLYALHSTDGSMVEIGGDTVVSGGSNGFAAARRRRLVWVDDDTERELASVETGQIVSPCLSPDGSVLAYAVKRGEQVEYRMHPLDDSRDRLLMTWPSAPLRWAWAPDGSRLFALLPGDWDWQLWEIPLDDPPRALMREAAAVRGLAVASDGRRIAIGAQATLDYRSEKYDVFVIDRTDASAAQRYTVAGQSAVDLAWQDDDALLVIVTDPTHATVPTKRQLARLELSDGSVVPFP